MTIEDLRKYISAQYGAEAEFPWLDDSDSMVFRHCANRKWFAVAMKIGRDKLGLNDAEKAYVVNFKCDPELSLAVRDGKSIFPAYHMNKEKWITVLLDGGLSDETVKMLLDESFMLTLSPIGGRKRGRT